MGLGRIQLFLNVDDDLSYTNKMIIVFGRKNQLFSSPKLCHLAIILLLLERKYTKHHQTQLKVEGRLRPSKSPVQASGMYKTGSIPNDTSDIDTCLGPVKAIPKVGRS